jgi:nucleoid-associated protein YgaU
VDLLRRAACLVLLAAAGCVSPGAGRRAGSGGADDAAAAGDAERRVRLEVAEREGDWPALWLYAGLLEKDEPDEARWAAARTRAARELGDGGGDEGRLREVFRRRLREAEELRRDASRAAADRESRRRATASSAEKDRRRREDLERMLVHRTLLLEERERVERDELASPDRDDRLRKLDKKIAHWDSAAERLKAESSAEGNGWIDGRDDAAGDAADRRRIEAEAVLRAARQDWTAFRAWEDSARRSRATRDARRTPERSSDPKVRPADGEGSPPGGATRRGRKSVAGTDPATASSSPVPGSGPGSIGGTTSARASAPAPTAAFPSALPGSVIPAHFSPPSLSPTPPPGLLRAAPGARLYLVQKGDTLPQVAAKVYGDAGRWSPIYEANKDSIFRGLLVPGEWLLIP